MQNSSINRERIDKNGIQSSPLPDFLAEPIKKKDNHPDCPFRGPYRARTGDLHNAIVALSHAELTAHYSHKIYPRIGAKSIRNSLQGE